MDLETKIIKRWQDWWQKNIEIPHRLSEDTFRSLVTIALEEVERLDRQQAMKHLGVDAEDQIQKNQDAIDWAGARLKEMQEATLTKDDVKQMARDAYTLLAGSFIEGHLKGLELLERAKQINPEAVKEVDAELEAEA